MEDRRKILTKIADQLLVRGRIRTQEEQTKLDGILLEIEGMNIKITGSDSDIINNQVPRIRRKKTAKNKQLILTF